MLAVPVAVAGAAGGAAVPSEIESDAVATGASGASGALAFGAAVPSDVAGEAVAPGTSVALALGTAGTARSRGLDGPRRTKTRIVLPARTSASPRTGAQRRRRGNRLAGPVIVAGVGDVGLCPTNAAFHLGGARDTCAGISMVCPLPCGWAVPGGTNGAAAGTKGSGFARGT